MPTRRICTAMPASATVSATALASPPVMKWFSAVTTRGTRPQQGEDTFLVKRLKGAYMKQRGTHSLALSWATAFRPGLSSGQC